MLFCWKQMGVGKANGGTSYLQRRATVTDHVGPANGVRTHVPNNFLFFLVI